MIEVNYVHFKPPVANVKIQLSSLNHILHAFIPLLLTHGFSLHIFHEHYVIRMSKLVPKIQQFLFFFCKTGMIAGI